MDMRGQEHNEFNNTGIERYSLKDLISSFIKWYRYFRSKWYIILLAGVIGSALGLAYAFIKKPVFTATTSFVLETGGKTNALSAYASIASNFGIDLGGSGGGLFEGENILELYRSRNMISRTLLSEANFDGKKQLLINRYVDFQRLRESWEDEPELSNITFEASNKYSTSRQQLVHDSIISKIVKTIDKNDLKVSKIDKKLNIIEVKLSSKDELFAKAFNEALVTNVNQFYLDTKTKRNLQNVSILQTKTDSVRDLLKGSINKAVAVSDATPNQNPTRMVQRDAPIQNAVANAEVNKDVLGTLLQNLELSKISLLKDTPLIQIVDEPILPLEKNEVKKIIALFIGGFLAVTCTLFILAVKKLLKSAMAD